MCTYKKNLQNNWYFNQNKHENLIKNDQDTQNFKSKDLNLNEKWPNYAKLNIEEYIHPRENANENTDEKWQRYANFIKIDMHTFYYFGRYAVNNTPIYLIFNGKKWLWKLLSLTF